MAAHLVSCEREIILGLARKSPWFGLEEDAQVSCYGQAVAVVARIASSTQRPGWRRTRDLERAQVAAYRHQALAHWRRVNAECRRGDKFTVVFDPELHSQGHAPIDALFEQPDLHAVENDLLAELVRDQLREFWTIVLREQVGFNVAGDRLGLTKAGVVAHTRAGRAAFGRYLERRASGELCAQRGVEIEAHRRGTASPIQSIRARAHLEACYVCALAFEPQTSAFQRGILSISPLGLILRMSMRASDLASSSATRVGEGSTGARAVALGVAALAVAGTSVGVKAATDGSEQSGIERSVGADGAHDSRPAALGGPAGAPPPVVEANALSARLLARDTRPVVARRREANPPRTRDVRPVSRADPTAAVASPSPEFDVEHSAAAGQPAPAAPTASAPSPTPKSFLPAADASTPEFPTP